MSFQADPAAPWRSSIFAGVKVRHITVPECKLEYEPAPVDDDCPAASLGVQQWLVATDEWTPGRGEARVAYSTGRVLASYVVGNSKQPDGLGSEIPVDNELPYNYFNKQTRLQATTDGWHYRAAPCLQSAAINSMLHAQSVEEYARTAGFKLPRITASDSGSAPDPLGGQAEDNSMLVNRFEALRGIIGDHAAQDDYSHRLHSLARVVLHATVVKASAYSNGQRDAMRETKGMQSVLTAALPLVRPESFRGSSWWYVGSELSVLFRAFLVMGARGVNHFATVGTVYAGLLSEPEVSSLASTPIIFVRKTGQLTLNQIAPQPAHYLQVLDNPELALSFYNAYAQSIGLVHEAAEIMLQTAVGPFVWGEDAVMPYRATAPKMDAAAYLFAENAARSHLSLLNVESIVSRACIVGKGVLAGAASLLGGFKRGKRVKVDDVLSRVLGALSDPTQSRALVSDIWRHLAGPVAGLNWVHPFDHVQDGVDRCVRAFREAGWLLAWYKTCPSSALAGVFDHGVDMGGAILGESDYRGDQYRELFVYQLAKAKPLQMLSESYTQAALAPVEYQLLGRLRAWRAVCRPLRFASKENDNPLKKAKGITGKVESEYSEEEVSASLQFLRAVPATATMSDATAKKTVVPMHARQASSTAGSESPALKALRRDTTSSTSSNGEKLSGGKPPSQAASNVSKRSSPSQGSVSISGANL